MASKRASIAASSFVLVLVLVLVVRVRQQHQTRKHATKTCPRANVPAVLVPPRC